MRKLVKRDDDQGFTMIAVLASAFLVMGLVLVTIAFAQSAVTRSRVSQDSRTALAAAQAGVNDFISRMNNCETYYLQEVTAQGCATVNSALGAGKWATLPGTVGTNLAQYNQRILMTPLDAGSNGVVRIKVTGTAHNGAESRTLTVDLKRKSFLDWLYFTDYETFSPKNTALFKTSFTASTGNSSYSRTFTGSGTSKTITIPSNTTYTVLQPTEDQVAAGCRRYYYQTPSTPKRTTFPRTVQWTEGLLTKTQEIWPASGETAPQNSSSDAYSCLTINFGKFDVFNGPVHSNDGLSVGGAVKFYDTVTSGWNVTQPWYGSNPATGANLHNPTYKAPTALPATTDQQKLVAAAGGCLYSGPTSIEFLSNGKMKVKSPQTVASTLNNGCSTSVGNTKLTGTETVNGPANGVIYVQGGTTSNVCVAEFQNYSGDVTTYDNNSCRAGDAFVEGTVKGAFTVAAEHDVIVTDDIVYQGSTGTDVLGLIGSNNVAVWHPVNAAGTNLLPVGNRRIDAAMASVQNSFTVLNYNKGAPLGTLTINGVIIQRFRGPVATTNSSTGNQVTGYAKNYVYDTRLKDYPPPTFIEPVNDPWVIQSLSEQKVS